VSKDSSSFENRYLSPKFVDFWMADKGMEAGRNLWRQRLLSCLPFELPDSIRVLDLGAGTGALSLDILNRYPHASLTCLDFSEAMLSHARQNLANFKEKVTFVQSNLQNPGWAQTLEGTYDAVVSSFLTHTIPDSIQTLYKELFGLVNSQGCFLSCDIFSPPGSALEGIYYKTKLRDHQYLIKMKTGTEKSLSEVEQVLHVRSQSYKELFGNSDAMKSKNAPTLMKHLQWLADAGFNEVDCLMKHTNNAIISGFRHSL
jgi:tRNA (cmo5U34)-methyltransferase